MLNSNYKQSVASSRTSSSPRGGGFTLHPRVFSLRQGGFTLIELLVVIAIIGILSSVVLVSLGKARKKAHYAQTVSNLKAIALAMEMTLDDEGASEWWPVTFNGGDANDVWVATSTPRPMAVDQEGSSIDLFSLEDIIDISSGTANTFSDYISSEPKTKLGDGKFYYYRHKLSSSSPAFTVAGVGLRHVKYVDKQALDKIIDGELGAAVGKFRYYGGDTGVIVYVTSEDGSY